jgi:hypothetical protein
MKLSDLALERFVLGELPDPEAARVRHAVAADASLGERLRALETSREDEAIAALARNVRTRLAGEPSPAPWARWAVPAAIAIVIAVAVAQPFERTPTSEAERIKGPDATLTIYRQTPSGSEQLDDRSVAHTGDVIRIGYRVNGDGFGAIVSVDGRGTVTVHYPDGAPTARPMSGGRGVLLSHAYELDDAPRWERFYIVTGAAPFPIETIVDAVERAASGGAASPVLDLAPEMTQATFLLQKDSRP